MKNAFILLCTMIITFLGSACTYYQSITINEKDWINALEEENRKKFISFFSKETQKLPDFSQKVDELLEFFSGEVLSYCKIDAEGTHEEFEEDMYKKTLISNYIVTTTDSIYRIAIEAVVANTKNENEIGITSFLIKATDDDDSESSYWGDGKFSFDTHKGIWIDNYIP